MRLDGLFDLIKETYHHLVQPYPSGHDLLWPSQPINTKHLGLENSDTYSDLHSRIGLVGTLLGRECLLGGTGGFWGMEIMSTSWHIIFFKALGTLKLFDLDFNGVSKECHLIWISLIDSCQWERESGREGERVLLDPWPCGITWLCASFPPLQRPFLSAFTVARS